MENTSFFESIKTNINLNDETLSDDDEQSFDNLETFKKPEHFGFYHCRLPSPINELNIGSGTVIAKNLLSEIELSESEDESQVLMCFMKSKFAKPLDEEHYEDFKYLKKEITKTTNNVKLNNGTKNLFITTGNNININTAGSINRQKQLRSTNNIKCIHKNIFNHSESTNKSKRKKKSTLTNTKQTKNESPHLSIKRPRKRNKNNMNKTKIYKRLNASNLNNNNICSPNQLYNINDHKGKSNNILFHKASVNIFDTYSLLSTITPSSNTCSTTLTSSEDIPPSPCSIYTISSYDNSSNFNNKNFYTTSNSNNANPNGNNNQQHFNLIAQSIDTVQSSSPSISPFINTNIPFILSKPTNQASTTLNTSFFSLTNPTQNKSYVNEQPKIIDTMNPFLQKKPPIKKRRKYKPDDIRKKIKARFHKILKAKTNLSLELAGSQKLFDFLPQSFLCNISRDKNKEVLDLTYYQLIQKDFVKDIDTSKYKKIEIDKTKHKHNCDVLKYLDSHKDISRKSGFDIISKMTYREILEEYFKSEEFLDSVETLKEKEDDNYIKEYVNKAKDYVNFFSSKYK